MALPEGWAAAAQYALPKQGLTRLAGAFAGARLGGLTHAVIRRFVARYGVDMSEALNPRIESYASFNDFFTRALRPDVRPMAQTDYVCPVDGAISQFGVIEQGQIFQAKGHAYTARALLADEGPWADAFTQGQFATLYLSPRDYHRIHMPCAGRLLGMAYVPGALFSVNPATVRRVPSLFARNERVVCRFDTAHGPLALVLVGATIVGSMATAWHGVVNPPRPREIRHFDYRSQRIELAQGAEMGRFLLGSTVILLWPRDTLAFNPVWAPGGAIRMGQMLGQIFPEQTR